MADLSRERLLELERATKDKTGELFSLISMALRCLAMQEALSWEAAMSIKASNEADQARLRAYAGAARSGK